MPISEARLNACRQNGARSKGPATPEGRAISARNSLKHGLTGEGIVVPEGDAKEIRRRVKALTADMNPLTEAGVLLIEKMARFTLRSENAADHEIAETASRMRNAADAFDEARIEKADELFKGLADDPRGNHRKLKKRPEGVERLIDEWHELRADLVLKQGPDWTLEHYERAALMNGSKPSQARGSQIGALSDAIGGDFAGLYNDEGGDLDDQARREWARLRLVEEIDGEIEALEAHYNTLDHQTIAIDRAGAGRRARFDASKEACLAQRYESEAERGFYKALKEFQQIEAEAKAQAEAAPTPSVHAQPEVPFGSFREADPSADDPFFSPAPRPRPAVAPPLIG